MKFRSDAIYNSISAISRSEAVRRFIQWMLPFRFWVIIGMHTVLFSISYLMTYLLLYGILAFQAEFLMWQTLLPLVAIRLLVYWYYDLFQGMWRYVSFEDLLIIIRATIVSSIGFMVLGFIWDPLRLADRFYALDWILCIMLNGGIRFMVRNFREKFVPGNGGVEMKKVLIVGPVGSVHPLVKNLTGDPYSPYYLVAIVDPGKDKHAGSTRLSDVPVWTLQQAVLQKKRLAGLAAIILYWPKASRKQFDALVDELKFLQAPFKTVPPIEEILSDQVTISDMRDVEIEDLLERPPIRIEMDRIRDNLEGKSVLVTGGGGSIGSELCRQIVQFNPALLVILDRSENNLYDLEIELRKKCPQIPLEVSLSTINDYPGLRVLLERKEIDLIFHAAAYKHVPLMESAPIECAYNNIVGTSNLVRAARDTEVDSFVMISTDKAVNPTNVMGVNKRIAEMLVQSYNGQTRTKFMTVRFGNVLGSAGSVVPLFKDQILQGGPVTVTHPEIERYFMTIPEAVQLVLQAGTMGGGGEIFVLEMGKPVKILHLAEKLITLTGRRPHEDIEILFTGLRPGEKMYEELFHRGEQHSPTPHAQIRVALSRPLGNDYMKTQVEEIRRLVLKHDETALMTKFKELVPEYCAPDNACVEEMEEKADSSKLEAQS